MIMPRFSLNTHARTLSMPERAHPRYLSATMVRRNPLRLFSSLTIVVSPRSALSIPYDRAKQS
jgi:hypothetical protein